MQNVLIFGKGETSRLYRRYIQFYSRDWVIGQIDDNDSTDEWIKTYPPDRVKVTIAIQSNLYTRESIYEMMKELDYEFYTFIHPTAFIDSDVKVGEGCFIFENNEIQSQVEIGANTLMWSCNHVGHQTTIGKHCFLSSHVVVCGNVTIGDRCFFGVNSAIAPDIRINDDAVIGMGANILKDVSNGEKVSGFDSRKLWELWKEWNFYKTLRNE